MDAESICEPPLNFHVFRHGWGRCVCGEKEWPVQARMAESSGHIPESELQPELPSVSQLQENECPGEAVYHGGAQQHDWRLWERWLSPGMPSVKCVETWYCTRCRKIEERKIPV